MKDSMRTMARPYAILFAIALVVALLARIGLAVMDAAGWLAYDYISASGVPMLDVICSILTGSAFVAFLFAAALTLMVSAGRRGAAGGAVRKGRSGRRQAGGGVSMGLGRGGGVAGVPAGGS